MVAVAVVAAAAGAVAVVPSGEGSGENTEKSSLRRVVRSPSGVSARDGARVGVTGSPTDVSPAREGRRDVRRRAACPLPGDEGRIRSGREAGPEKESRRVG